MLKIKLFLLTALAALSLTGCMNQPLNTAPLDSGVLGSSYSNADFKQYILNHSYKLEPNMAESIASYVSYFSKQNNVDPKLVLALIGRESSFRTDVVSSAGAIGLGQLMTGTAKDMGVTDPYNPAENIKGTTKYLSYLLKRSNGDVDRALASYNMGPNGVDRVLNSGGQLPSSVKKYVSDIKSDYAKV